MQTSKNESVNVHARVISRLLVRAVRVVLIIYLLVLVMLASLQRKLIYVPLVSNPLIASQYSELTQIYPQAEDVQITTSDGVQIRGWHLRCESNSDDTSARPLVMFFHGNAGNRLGRLGWYRMFRSFGVDVLAIDYRGYGDSAGEPSEVGLKADAEATWDYAVKTLGYVPKRICVTGISMGGAIAINLASKKSASGSRPGGLIVVATFSSMQDTAAFHYPWLPVRWVLIDKFPSQEDIRNVTCPLLSFHGDQDNVVPLKLGQRLFKAAPEASSSGIPKTFVLMPGVGHRGLADAGQQYYQARIPLLLEAAGIVSL